MTRYLIETTKVDARMVHHEHTFSFGDKGGLLDECGFLRNPRWVQGLKTLEDVANERGAVIILWVLEAVVGRRNSGEGMDYARGG